MYNRVHCIKQLLLTALLLLWCGCKDEHTYTVRLYFVKRNTNNGKTYVEWKQQEFKMPADSFAYEYGLHQFLKESHQPSYLIGTPLKFEVYDYKGKRVVIQNGFY